MPSLTPLRHRAFALFWTGQALSELGDWAFFIARTSWVYEHTGSTAVLAAVALAGQLPFLLLTLVGGTLADHLPRRALQVASDLVRATIQLGAAAAAAAGTLTPAGLVALTALHGAVAACSRPAWRALVPQLVPAPDRHAANALVALMRTASGLLGPALGGLLVAAGGVPAALTADGLSYLLAAALLWGAGPIGAAIPEAGPAARGSAGLAARLAAAAAGWRELAGLDPSIRITLAVMALINVTGQAPVVLLRPWLAARLGGDPAAMLGALHTAFAAGMTATAALLGLRRPARPVAAIYGALAAVGLAMAAMALTRSLSLVLACQALIGALVMVEGVLWEGLLQERVPADRLGRMAALDELGRSLLYPAGLGLVGRLAGEGREQLALAAGGLLTGLLALAGLLASGVRSAR